ncbi:hypothetical protein [Streptomyces virginiae]
MSITMRAVQPMTIASPSTGRLPGRGRPNQEADAQLRAKGAAGV